MSHALHIKYPAIADLACQAKRRIPHFAWEYLDSGTGIEDCVPRNRDAFSKVLMTPEFMKGSFESNVRTRLLGVEYDQPFGVAPVGFTGLM